MTTIFADTSGWGHLVDSNQPYHSQAASIYRLTRNQGERIITTNYILTELVALMTSPLKMSRPTIIQFITSIKTSPFVQVIHIDQELDRIGWNILKQHHDKNWSLVDCSSFALMKQLELDHAFTSDHHFEQYGFIRLLK